VRLAARVGGLEDLLHVRAHLTRRGHRLADRFRVAGDGGEQVVEVVRDATRQLAHGFHLLRLPQLLLQRLAQGDVGDGPVVVGHLPVGPQDAGARHQAPEDRAIAPPEADLLVDEEAVRRDLPLELLPPVRVLVEHAGSQHQHLLRAGVPEHPGERLVHVHQSALRGAAVQPLVHVAVDRGEQVLAPRAIHGDAGQDRGALHQGDLPGAGGARLPIVDREGAEHLAPRRPDRHRPAGPEPMPERQVAVGGPQRIGGDVAHHDGAVLVRGGAAGAGGRADLPALEGGGVGRREPRRPGHGDQASLQLEHGGQAAVAQPLDPPAQEVEDVRQGLRRGDPLEHLCLPGQHLLRPAALGDVPDQAQDLLVVEAHVPRLTHAALAPAHHLVLHGGRLLTAEGRGNRAFHHGGRMGDHLPHPMAEDLAHRDRDDGAGGARGRRGRCHRRGSDR
jgi:hypothetical protein